MEELRICREECEILKQKLHIHLDRWTLDKIMFDEFKAKAAKEKRLQEASHAYEVAAKDLVLGSQEQQLLLLKSKLESAVENSELEGVQISALRCQLQNERKWLESANRKRRDMIAKLALMSASKDKLLKEAEKEKQHHQKLLDDSRTYALELEQVNGKHMSTIAKLKEEVEQLKSHDDLSKAQAQWIRERQELLRARQERDHLRAQQEQWKSEQEIQARRDERTVGQQEMQDVFEEIGKLKVERENWLSKEENTQKLERERDCLQRKLEGTLCQYHDDLVKERDKLKHELELISNQRKEEVKALVRERDFVWSQMKKVEESYSARIKKTTGLMLQEKRENDRLRKEVQQMQANKDEAMIEMTAVRLGRTEAERLAAQKQHDLEADLQELHLKLEKVHKEKNHALAPECKERTSPVIRKGTLEQLLASPAHHSPQEEVLNAAEGLTQDEEIFESQVQQATQTDMKKKIEDLQLENKNLKSLYAEAEASLHAKRQKPSRGANKQKNRDPTSRNLKLELEAAATCSKGHPLSAVKSREVKRLKTGDESFGSTAKPKQINSAPASGKLGVDGAINSERLEISRRQTRSSKRESWSEKANLDEIQRPPLHKISLNQKGDAKSLLSAPSAGKGHQESEKRTLLGSPSKSGKMMANLFSSSFSVPKLKSGRTPRPLRT